ncbi:peptide chain release factor N(5)-glutamine methyltransferase [Clostridium sp. SHJSY1]|uniref:peptide chain release factor N(5)-glutamine methyltransferase n=1 Tax=Clostridium sp. SHJSY1 TaxID=2942483 RepID=UPI002875134E|nr:peptide chain release factor N(5)-glutamine methyltransferase [Clostridium sp. SHJSY1]MDS0528295.1 peptide chain release factor N(5)-glutamine methyltransferase [Clostridium sp. SHJSY1]
MRKADVGGQAVIEGVMMRGTKGLATAVRKEDGEIVIDFKNVTPINKRYKVLNIPFIRGIFVLIDSLKIGIKSLNYSASFFEDTEPSKFEDWLRGKFGEKANDVIIGITMVIAFIIAIGLFVGLPTAAATLFKGYGLSAIGLNLVEALIRIIILILYIWGISKMEDIYRVFQYHGAEHKTIFCYEAEEALTVENVKKFSRFHPRCGTNFLFLIMLVSVIIISFTGWGGFIERLIIRVILIPIISGITYEVIKWLGKSESQIAKIIAYPGLQLQKLTTREPDGNQIEVAIASLMAAEGIEEEKKNIGELLNLGSKILSEAEIDTARLDAQLLLGKVINKDKIYLITNNNEKVNNKDKKEFLKLINKRKDKMPIKYILGECDFFGLDLYVEEGVLIPRSDTEVLVEEVLKFIGDEDDISVCDLCSGSGAIGVALAYNRKNIKVDAIDYYEIPEKVTKKNIERNKLEDRVTFIKSDLLSEVIKLDKKYNIVVSNPPYIKEEEIGTLMRDVKDYEPHTALSGGGDGLVFYRRIVKESKQVLLEGGILSFEIGYDQGESVKAIMETEGYADIKIIKDLSGLDRVVIGKLT